ncbi:MAG: nitronate monooxygenase [Pseudomonadales bacterium]|nr:nitronate monooxygenase [Pseudomonadales bacterium]
MAEAAASISNSKMGALRTPICETLGIDYPIFQAGMGYVARHELAAAVSAAGGLGCIGSGYMTPDVLKEEIAKLRAITDKPFGVNILFGRPSQQDNKHDAHIERMAQVAIDAEVPVIVSGLGSPSEEICEKAHKKGIFVMSVIGAARHAAKAAAGGVDGLIASGQEGGGHVGQIGTAVLIPSIVDATDLPLIAAGGFADGRGLVMALAMGAQGIWMGTRFITTEESYAHENYKQKIVDIDLTGTIVCKGHSGKTCRLIKNDFTDYWESHPEEILPFPRQLKAVGEPASIAGRENGDMANGSCPAGQTAGLIHKVKPAGQLVQDIVAEAHGIIGKLGVMAGQG